MEDPYSDMLVIYQQNTRVNLPGNIKHRGTQATEPTVNTQHQLIIYTIFFFFFGDTLPSDTKTSRFSPPMPNATAAQKDNKKTRNRFLHHFTLKSSLPDLHLRNIPFSKIFVAGNSMSGALWSSQMSEIY